MIGWYYLSLAPKLNLAIIGFVIVLVSSGHASISREAIMDSNLTRFKFATTMVPKHSLEKSVGVHSISFLHDGVADASNKTAGNVGLLLHFSVVIISMRRRIKSGFNLEA